MSITIYGSGTIGGLVSGWPEDLTITTADLVDGAVTNVKIDTVANTKVTGVMTAAQIATIANTQITGVMTVESGGTGAATLTANNVILGAGTSTPTFVAPGTSGNVLASNGTTWTSGTPGPTTSKTIALSIIFGF